MHSSYMYAQTINNNSAPCQKVGHLDKRLPKDETSWQQMHSSYVRTNNQQQ